MNLIFAAAAVNPGVFAGSPITTQINIAIACVLASFVGTMVFVVLSGSAAGRKRTVFVVISSIFAITTVAFVGVVSFTAEASNADSATRTSAYADDVSEWLEDNYQIVAGAGTVTQLVYGETVKVEYHGETVNVTLVKTEDGDVQLTGPLGAGLK